MDHPNNALPNPKAMGINSTRLKLTRNRDDADGLVRGCGEWVRTRGVRRVGGGGIGGKGG